MKDQLKAQTNWARHDGGPLWTLGLKTPIAPELLGWIVQTYKVERVETLPSNTAVLLLVDRSHNVAALMELPKPCGGSRHESNQIVW